MQQQSTPMVAVISSDVGSEYGVSAEYLGITREQEDALREDTSGARQDFFAAVDEALLRALRALLEADGYEVYERSEWQASSAYALGAAYHAEQIDPDDLRDYYDRAWQAGGIDTQALADVALGRS